MELRRVPGGWADNCIDVRGVGADPFDPVIWQRNTLNLVPHAGGQATMVEIAGAGKYRNIYAPSVVEIDRGAWRIYFAGWDGSETPNDQVYCVETRDFISLRNRHTSIEHGQFQHVCNVNVTPAPPAGGFAMMCTAFPDADGHNKPVTFFSRDGIRWKGAVAGGATPPATAPHGGPLVPSTAPHDENAFPATRDQIVGLFGYPNYAAAADVNGVNVLLFEDGGYRMYFGDFANGGKTWRATGGDGRRFKLDRAGGVALEHSPLVNDVKKFRTADHREWYLMGLHNNGDRLSFSVSDDGAKFPEAQTLCTNVRTFGDRYTVSIGWVTQGGQEDPGGRRLLGFLYGAGPKPTLDDNRIFARWLQKKLVFTAAADGKALDPQTWSLGPDRQTIFFDKPLAARVTLLGDDGITPIARTDGAVELRPGDAYEVIVDRSREAPAAAGRSR